MVVKQAGPEPCPGKRKSFTFSFRVADCEGYVTVGESEDGRPGEVFMKVSKQGSTLAGIMDAFAISVSLGLQHGVPLATFVRHFTNMRFEPAGMTDDPGSPFRGIAGGLHFPPAGRRVHEPGRTLDLGILTVGERTCSPHCRGSKKRSRPSYRSSSSLHASPGGGLGWGRAARGSRRQRRRFRWVVWRPRAPVRRPRSPPPVTRPIATSAGCRCMRAGSCFACPSCGTTSGCS